jgi:hypothetical protein
MTWQERGIRKRRGAGAGAAWRGDRTASTAKAAVAERPQMRAVIAESVKLLKALRARLCDTVMWLPRCIPRRGAGASSVHMPTPNVRGAIPARATGGAPRRGRRRDRSRPCRAPATPKRRRAVCTAARARAEKPLKGASGAAARGGSPGSPRRLQWKRAVRCGSTWPSTGCWR